MTSWRKQATTQTSAGTYDLQARVGGGDANQQIFTKALQEEIQGFREQRAQAQRRLRKVRRNLRRDKEKLGDRLFLLNTFLVPAILLFGIMSSYLFRRRGKGKVVTSS